METAIYNYYFICFLIFIIVINLLNNSKYIHFFQSKNRVLFFKIQSLISIEYKNISIPYVFKNLKKNSLVCNSHHKQKQIFRIRKWRQIFESGTLTDDVSLARTAIQSMLKIMFATYCHSNLLSFCYFHNGFGRQLQGTGSVRPSFEYS